MNTDLRHDNHVGVPQREIAFTTSEDKRNILTTIGLGPCIGIAMYNPDTKQASLVHLDVFTNTHLTINRMIRVLGNDAKKLQIYVAGGDNSSASQEQQLLVKDILEKNGAEIKGEMNTDKRSLLINAENGNVSFNVNGRTVNLGKKHNNTDINQIIQQSQYLALTKHTVYPDVAYDAINKGCHFQAQEFNFSQEKAEYSNLPKEHIWHSLSSDDKKAVEKFMQDKHSDKLPSVQANIMSSICREGNLNNMRRYFQNTVEKRTIVPPSRGQPREDRTFYRYSPTLPTLFNR